jgi:hypothetical protein
MHSDQKPSHSRLKSAFEDLLKIHLLRRGKSLGRALSQRELVDASMIILRQRIQSLAAIYDKLDAKH